MRASRFVLFFLFIPLFIVAEISRRAKWKGSSERALTFLHNRFVIANKCVHRDARANLKLSALYQHVPVFLTWRTHSIHTRVQIPPKWRFPGECHTIMLSAAQCTILLQWENFRTHETSTFTRRNTYCDSTKKDHSLNLLTFLLRLSG